MTKTNRKLTDKQQAVLYILVSAFGFASMSMLVKLSGDLPVMQKSFFRNFISTFVALAAIRHSGGSLYVKKENRMGVLARAAFGTVGMLCNYYALRYMILPDATILTKLSPFFTILYSFFLLKETVTKRQWMAITISFLGCVFVLQPSFSSGQLLPAMVAVIGGATTGIAYVYVRFLTRRGEEKNVIIFYFSLFSCLVSIPFMLAAFSPMSTFQVITLIGSGIAAAVGQFGMTNAYARAPGRFLGPFEYSQLLFSAIYSYFIFGQVPTLVGLMGYGVILAVSLWMLKSE